MPTRVKFRLLIDEDLDIALVQFLKKAGHDVLTTPKGLKNGSVYNLALRSRRILLTGDKDFTDSFAYPPKKTKGIAVIRVHPVIPVTVIPLLRILLTLSPKKLKNKLILLEPNGLRII